MSKTKRTLLEHSQRDQQQQDQYTKRDEISDAIEGCARTIGRVGHPDYPRPAVYASVAETCLDVLAPLLQEQTARSPLSYQTDLGDDEGFDGDALTWLLQSRPQRFTHNDKTEMKRVERAFRSLAAIAEHEDIIVEELRNRVDVYGWTLKLGEHLQDWEMDLPGPVGGIADEVEAVKTLHCGGTGQGKSTALEVEAEDFYQQTHQEGRDYKLIDLVDIDKGENWFVDIPQQQGKLRRIREEEMNLPADFAVSGQHGQPEVDIRLPLTPGLTDERLPYDTEAEEFQVTPFVIPASKIPKRILIPCIMGRVSDDQERTIRKAYDDVERGMDDWALCDLADEIRERDELSPKHKSDALGVLRSLQDLGFIRTKESEHTLDWTAIFKDTERITIFSQAMLETQLGKFFLIAYLVDEILDQRQDLYGLPEAVLLMRELWEVTPQRGRLSPDERAANVQEALANRMAKVMRKLRHFDLHLIGDTQEPGDLHKSVRERFNRYVVFNANRDTVDNVFSWTSNDRKTTFWRTLNMKKGQAGVVGYIEPAVQERNIEFISPMAYAPPSHHHYDKHSDTNGWRTRTKYLTPTEECPECGSDDLDRHIDGLIVHCVDCGEITRCQSLGREEVLKRPASVPVGWRDHVPPELDIDEQTGRDGPDPVMRPVAAFAEECLDVVNDEKEYEFLTDIRTAFNDYREEQDLEPWDFSTQSKMVTFGERLRDHYPDGTYERKRRTRGTGQRENALIGLTFTDQGYQHAKAGGQR